MINSSGYSLLSYCLNSLSSKPAKYRTEFFWGGTVLLFSLLAFGSSAFAQATFNSATLAFGDHAVNVPSGVKKAWLTNTQTVPVTISSIAISGGNAPGDYVLDAGGDCPLSPKTLGAGDKCNIPVTFTPSALGSRTATLTVTDDASNSPQTVALTGTGTEPVDLTPSPLSFGNQSQGTTGAAKKATLTNHQAATLTNISISASGDYARTGGTCPASGGTLAAGASCTILMEFTPTILGSDPGTLTVVDGASNSPQSVALTGTGTSPVTLSVSSLYLGTVVGGNTSAAKSVTLTNRENVALAFSNIATSGDFAITSNTCGTGIAAGAKCTVGVTFSPTATGARTGALAFTDNAANSPQTVSLSGTGSSLVTVSPASLTFTSATVGVTSAAQTVTLKNRLTTSVTVSTPVAAGDFAVVSNTCPASVGPGRTCSVAVTFTPTEVGTRTGALTIPYSAFGSPIVVPLSGTGLAPLLLSIAVTPANPSIFPGQTQQFTATGTYNNGSTQNLTSTATWSSSAPGVATINAAGLASTIGEGQTTIEAALGAINSSTTLNVTRFVLTGSMNTGRDWHTATLLNNGMVLMAGGYTGNSVLASAELYNPATSTFTPTGSMNNARYLHTATLLNNGMVLIAGGISSTATNAPISDAELYDPTTGTFTPTGSMNNARFVHTATLLNNGTVIMAGGIGSSNDVLVSAELYNPSTGTFTPTGSLNTARYFHTATLLNNGMVLMAGGEGGGATAELYNAATGAFTRTGSLNTARANHTATLLNNGMVLMGGGYYSSLLPLADAELYNSATETFSYTIGTMNTARFIDTATLLNNGSVLIAGGQNFVSAFASAELYNAATGTFSATGSMNYTRTYDTATLLNNGMVLMAGGEYGGASAELYIPVTLTPPNLESIAITPATSTLSPGGTQQFIATGTFSDGSTQQLASVTWSSSNTKVAQITNDVTNHGVALAIAKGTVTIAATVGTVSGTATLTVQ